MYLLIDLIHKSHNAPVPYPTVHHFVPEMRTFLLENGALWDSYLMHCAQVLKTIYSTMPLERDHFSTESPQQTPHSSPVRTIYGMSFVIWKSDLCFAPVILSLYVIS